MSINTQITFLLNDALCTIDVPPALVALDFLRKNKNLTGSKEGCKEGDCGACTVIVGEYNNKKLSYRPMTSCLLPMGELHGKHLVSIEGLNMKTLSPVQHAMVDCGATQCGYCTPGFVVALTAGLMDCKIPLDKKGVDYATSGNLCRCTGYRSIKEAGENAYKSVAKKLEGPDRIRALCQSGAIPEYFSDVETKLKNIAPLPSASSDSSGPILAGGTDLFVQKGEEIPEGPARLLNQVPIETVVEIDGMLRVDARMSFEAFANDLIIQAAIPEIQSYNELIASWPIRTRATLAGNICNASPIADMTCLLLALGAELILEKDGSSRTVALHDFYLGYKKLAKDNDELIQEIQFKTPDSNTLINWEKVSKRKVLDIATVNSAALITSKNGLIQNARLSVGGVAATPLFLQKTSGFLVGKNLETATILEALAIAQTEFNPISDVRGSAPYKRLLARQLLLSHFTKLFPETLKEDEIYASLR